MSCSRREFVAMGMSVAAAQVGDAAVFTGTKGDFDEELSVFLSDTHVCGDPAAKRWLFTQSEFDKRISEILKMHPLPRNVVVFGDLCFDHGDIRDYRIVRKGLDLLSHAGIKVTVGMGNHDRRNAFFEVFPEYASSSLVPGRVVSVVDLGRCDLVLLDSLKAADGAARGPTEGSLDKSQQEWLADFLPKCKRPVFVAAHHPSNELWVCGKPIVTTLKDAPMTAGWINGHEHYWIKEPLIGGGKYQDTIRGLNLPSAGLWGDIGSVVFKASLTEAVATLDEKAYWYNDLLQPGEREPEVWKAIAEENQGQFCRFPYSRAYRAAV